MLDTLKVAIPLSRTQHKRIAKVASLRDVWTHALINQQTGDLVIRRYQGVAQADGESYHREIRFDFPPVWTEDARLWCEFSVTKLWYGHNIRLLYDWPQALRHFRDLLNRQFDLKRCKLPEVETWEVWRADPCYAFQFPTQQTAQLYLDSLKRQRFPRKQPTINKSSIFFGGGTYSFKVYLKQPEFMAHDRRELLKQKASLEWVEYLERISEGILRVEATLRRKYLQRNGIKVVGDMIGNRKWLEWDSHYANNENFDELFSLMAITTWALHEEGVDLSKFPNFDSETKLVDGRYYHAPDITVEFNDVIYQHPHGGYIYHDKPILIDRLRILMHKFLGGVQGMETADKLKSILMRHYKPTTASKLVAFWLYVQKFGSEEAKVCFGRDSFYYQRRQLKAAGVGLMEAHENIIKVDPEFFRTFKLDLPSEYASNRFDDFRNSGNLLNLRPDQTEAG